MHVCSASKNTGKGVKASPCLSTQRILFGFQRWWLKTGSHAYVLDYVNTSFIQQDLKGLLDEKENSKISVTVGWLNKKWTHLPLSAHSKVKLSNPSRSLVRDRLLIEVVKCAWTGFPLCSFSHLFTWYISTMTEIKVANESKMSAGCPFDNKLQKNQIMH